MPRRETRANEELEDITFSAMSLPNSIPSLVACLSLLALLAGCGASYDATISGTVTMDGAPLTKGTVSFHPNAGGAVATGKINIDGSFTVQTATTKGLEPGEYKVTVVATDPPPPSTNGEELPGILLTAPEFGRLDSTPLKFTVEAGANQFDIPVTSAPAS